MTISSFAMKNTVVLRTDASNTVIGLRVKISLWHLAPLDFISSRLWRTVKRYSAYNRDLLGIFAAIKHIQHFPEFRLFTVFT